MNIKIYVLYFTLLFTNLGLFAQAPIIKFTSVATSLSQPVDIVSANDGTGRLFIVEQTGTVRILQNGSVLSTPFLNVASLTDYDPSNGERGLLSIAFHPQYSTNGYFFIYYTNTSGSITIARYRVSEGDANIADASSGVILLTITKPYANHNGGKLNFGKDGDLYFGTGDGGSGGNPENTAQSLNSLLGKLIRINVDAFSTPPYYTIPEDNPYASSTDVNVKKEIWALGLRNPWRWSFDKQTGDLWLPDVGQSVWEEVNFRTAANNTGGLNYGWRCYEGNSTYNTSGCGAMGNYVFPIFQYPHNDTGGIAIVGGYFYRGNIDALQGYYLFTDYTSANGWLAKSDGSGGWFFTRQTHWPSPASSFGEDTNGDLYLTSLNGTIYKIGVDGALPVKLLSFTADKQIDKINFNWTTTNEINTSSFEIEQSFNGVQFTSIAAIPANNNAENNYTYSNDDKSIINSNENYFRLKIIQNDGNYTLSPVVKLNNTGYNGRLIYPTVIQDNVLHIYSAENIRAVTVINVSGNIVFEKEVTLNQSYLEVRLPPSMAKGMYVVKLFSDRGASFTDKVIIR
ncbi:PQQ-dependent sugar dehydrogenase [Ferruginibacter albus]|uniref:PQQ-dependent sugar dehydrogenase n=1 Tax=Ferruginibacter albus TaxID=2875540 RepID=UPI001CC4493B|nr:PQQ-dependent sugar dehydrogenase [Ferruginibacter albus]UAY51662.1 PQQ-dependent sugar dehydrogenase [Ferruginibacter albus]